MSSKLPVFCFTPFFFKRVLCFLLYILCKVVLLRSNSSEGGLVGLVPLHVTCCNWKLFETDCFPTPQADFRCIPPPPIFFSLPPHPNSIFVDPTPAPFFFVPPPTPSTKIGLGWGVGRFSGVLSFFYQVPHTRHIFFLKNHTLGTKWVLCLIGYFSVHDFFQDPTLGTTFFLKSLVFFVLTVLFFFFRILTWFFTRFFTFPHFFVVHKPKCVAKLDFQNVAKNPKNLTFSAISKNFYSNVH